ncbi:MAG: DNA polymerase [Minisyncoccia bacterium]
MANRDKKRIVLLDTHAILHRAYHALPDFATSKGEPTGALYGLITMLLKIAGDLKPNYIIAALDLPDKTHRHEVYEDYKGKRPETDDELVSQIKKAASVLEALNIPVYSKPGFEADDIIGTAVKQLGKEKDVEIIIASGDMDTLQLVQGEKVKVFTLKKGLNDTIMYDEKAVVERYGFGPKLLPDYKGLRGDPSDNIIGIKGIGEKTATTLITKFGAIEDIYKKLKTNEKDFVKIGLTERVINLLKEGEEEALFSKLLATIRPDTPVKILIPEKEWMDGLDLDALVKFLQNLEFRSLVVRVQKVFSAKTKGMFLENGEIVEEEQVKEKIPEAELKETAIALWVVDSNITNPTIEDILNFGKTGNFEVARENILKEIKNRNSQFVFEHIEKPIIPIAEEMTKYGVLIDKKYLEELSKEFNKKIKDLEKKIIVLAGEEFNVASPKQLGVILFEKLKLTLPRIKKTATGAYSTKEEELQKLSDQHEIIPLILEHRGLSKLVGTYVDAIPPLLDSSNRLHPTFMQAGTTTGRLSSKDPNIQNIPISSPDGKRIRGAFISGKGKKLLSFDYSQIDLRSAAILSKDEILVDIFKRGEDVHTAVASVIFGVAEDKVTKEERRRAKTINFGILYGMGVNALKAGLGTSRAEAEKFYNDYFDKFVGVTKYLETIKREAARTGFTETLYGRRRYFEGLRSKIPFIRAAAERMAINAPIQGTSADIVKLAMVQIDEYLSKEGLKDKVHLMLQIHDELVFEVDNEMVKTVAPKILSIMENIVSIEKANGVPILANAYEGERFDEMREIKL